jgi:hypothetical protein
VYHYGYKHLSDFGENPPGGFVDILALDLGIGNSSSSSSSADVTLPLKVPHFNPEMFLRYSLESHPLWWVNGSQHMLS